MVGRYAGSQGVSINLGGDGQFEGSQFDGGEGGVTVKAGGNLALNQANDRQDSDTSSLRGNASLKVGTLPGTNDTNINLGAGVQLDHKGDQTRDSQARVASIEGQGPVTLSSGGDLVLQGTRIDIPGAIDLEAGGKLDVQAATDTRLVKNSQLGGGLNVGGSKTSTEQGVDKAGNLSANFNVGRVDEASRTLTGGELKSEQRIGLSGDSIHLQGAQVSAPDVLFDRARAGSSCNPRNPHRIATTGISTSRPGATLAAAHPPPAKTSRPVTWGGMPGPRSGLIT